MRLSLDGPLPTTAEATVAEYQSYRAIRLSMEKEVAKVHARELLLERQALDMIAKSGDGVVVGSYVARVITTVKPTIAQGQAETVRAYAAANNRWDLLHAPRLAEKAVMDMLDAGVTIPGVEKFNRVSLSIRKL